MHSDRKWLQNQPVSDMLKVCTIYDDAHGFKTQHFTSSSKAIHYTLVGSKAIHYTPVGSKAIHYTPVSSKAIHYTPVGSKAIHYTPVGSKATHYTPVGSKAIHYTPVGSKAVHYTPVGSKAVHYTLVGFFTQCATPKVMFTPGANLAMYCHFSLQKGHLLFGFQHA